MSCNTVDQHCSHPANLEDVTDPRSRCVSCHEPVCINCSLVTRSRLVRLQLGLEGRVCGSCIGQLNNWDLCRRYVQKIHRLAGYGRTGETLNNLTREWYQPWFDDRKHILRFDYKIDDSAHGGGLSLICPAPDCKFTKHMGFNVIVFDAMEVQKQHTMEINA